VDLQSVLNEQLPIEPASLQDICNEIDNALVPHAVKTSHPLFLGYVTPPSLDICVLGDAITAILNQNVSFDDLSPTGTAIEQTVIRWLAEIVGYGPHAGGIMLSGGSMANLYALALGRRATIGPSVVASGNYAHPRRQRVYCSEHSHRSVHKAASILGVGVDNVVTVPTDKDHRIRLDELERRIESDLDDRSFVPTTIVGNAGTRLAGACDDLRGLYEIAHRHQLWFHVDAAFGGFFRLLEPMPKNLEHLPLADSITIDPHKLLFVPFDAGCVLVQNRQHLLDAFGVEGEYLEKSHPPGVDFADLGLQLGRSMKALKVWLALKYVGVRRYREELGRLVELASHFAETLRADPDFELISPVASTVVCFRWKTSPSRRKQDLDAINRGIRIALLRRGISFVNEVEVGGNVGIRVCFTNFRTEAKHTTRLLDAMRELAETLQ